MDARQMLSVTKPGPRSNGYGQFCWLYLDLETRAQPSHYFWAAADDSVQSLVAEASRRGLTLYNGQNIGVILEDPNNALFLNRQIRDALRDGVVRLFPRPQKIRVIIDHNAEIRSHHFASNATVASVARWGERAFGLQRPPWQPSEYELESVEQDTRVPEEILLLTLTNYPHRTVSLRLTTREHAHRYLQSPRETQFRTCLTWTLFQRGVEQKLWRLVEIDWPYAVVAIGQWAHQDNSFRFDLQTSPVTVGPWELSSNRRLERRHWPSWFAEFLPATGVDSCRKDSEEVLLTTLFPQHSLNLSPSLPPRYREFIECLLGLCEILMKDQALAKKAIACQGGPTC
jgi:hypothetical protein